MPYTLSPFLRSPFTDLTGGLISHQLLGKCQQQEMAMMDCMESYGLYRGTRRCQPYIRDFTECHKNTIRFQRFVAMRHERERQIAEGKLTGDKKYVSPRVDAY